MHVNRGYQTFLTVACLALAVLVVLLAWQNHQLKKVISETIARQSPPEGLKEGDTFPSLTLLDESGAPVSLEFGTGAGESLVLVYSSHCPACRETLPIWSGLLADPPAGLRVTAIRTIGAASDEPALPFPVLTPRDGGAQLSRGIPYIPATLILGADGTVERIWYGLPDQDAQRALREKIESHR
jgi:hypothetical protein